MKRVVIGFLLTFALLVNRTSGEEIQPAPDQWGEAKYGYQTQIIATSKAYVIGKLMTFTLVIKNVSDSVKMFDSQGIANNPLIIKDSRGRKIHYKTRSFQTVGQPHPIEPGKIVTLLAEYDVTHNYVIVEPGTYTVQCEGVESYSPDDYFGFPASNILTLEVQPGEPNKEDVLIYSLKDIAQERRWWILADWPPAQGDQVAPSGRVAVRGVEVLLGRGGKIVSVVNVNLWQTEAAADEKESAGAGEMSEYLGQNVSGYYYAEIPKEAEELWPTIREDIKKALNLPR